MSTIVPRLYPDEQTATEATSALRKVGFGASEVAHFTAHSGDDEASVAAAIAKVGVPPRHAAIYARHILEGRTLVVANCRPFFTVKAHRQMGRFNPIDAGIAEPDYFEQAWTSDNAPLLDGAPSTQLIPTGLITSSLGLPTLLGSSKQVSGLMTESKPFSKLSTDMKPFSKVGPGGPSLPFPTIIRGKND